MAFATQQKAVELAQTQGMKMLGTSLGKKEDRLKEAAKMMLKAGNF
jgi:hypothetical protein